MRDRKACPRESTDALDFILCIADMPGIDNLFRLEYRIDAFRRHDHLSLKLKNKRRVLPIQDHHINLIAKLSLAIYDVSCRGLIALGKVGLQQFQPNMLAGIA